MSFILLNQFDSNRLELNSLDENITYEIEYDDKACIVVIEYEGVSIGVIVDTVVNVIDVNIDKISKMPDNSREEMVSGIISLENGETLMVLDCDLLLNS